jgi:rod shape-determining protein MreC
MASKPSKNLSLINKIIVNSLIFCAAIFALRGLIQEACTFIAKSATSTIQLVSSQANLQIKKTTNSKDLIEQQFQTIHELEIQLKKSNEELNNLRVIAQRDSVCEESLKMRDEYFPKSVAARIIVRSPSSWQKQVIIDKGSVEGVKTGMVVVTHKGILGRIRRVEQNYSIVELMSGAQVRFGSMIHRSKVLGVLFGDKQGYAQLKFVPIGSDVQKGDLVQTTDISPIGVERLFPMSYPVGTVMEVSNDGNNSELMIRVKLFEDSSQATDVLVLFPGNKAKFINSLVLQMQQAKMIEEQNLTKQLAVAKSEEVKVQEKKVQTNLDNLAENNLAVVNSNQSLSSGLSAPTKNIPSSNDKKKEKISATIQNTNQAISQTKTITSPSTPNTIQNPIKPNTLKVITKPIPKPKPITAKVEEKTSLEENLSIDSLDERN